jgi:hypothetical protein
VICIRDRYKAIYRWLRDEPEFRAEYTRACATRALMLQEEAMDIARAATPATVRAAELQIDRLHGRIGRLTPKLYREAG